MKRVLVRADQCIGCKACEIACIQQHLDEDAGNHGHRPIAVSRIRVECADEGRAAVRSGDTDGPGHRGNRLRSYVVLCEHCDDPECVVACVSGALTKDPDEVVRYHPELCSGCLLCITACNYGAIYEDPDGKGVIKCDLCGGKETPSCVGACKVDALYLEPDAHGGK